MSESIDVEALLAEAESLVSAQRVPNKVVELHHKWEGDASGLGYVSESEWVTSTAAYLAGQQSKQDDIRQAARSDGWTAGRLWPLSNPWVGVSEKRKPADHQRVFVVMQDNEVRIAKYDKPRDTYFEADGSGYLEPDFWSAHVFTPDDLRDAACDEKEWEAYRQDQKQATAEALSELALRDSGEVAGD